GSNLLVRDGGFDGVVIATQKLDGFAEIGPGTFRVEAGVACARVAKSTAQSGYSGAEFMIGIPGSIGGAMAMNAGAYGSETWQLVTAVETLSRTGEHQQRAPEEFEIGYRHVSGPPGEWFVAACIRLEPAGDEDPAARVAELLAHRARTQPVGRPSCGSVFRNPPGQFAAELIERCGLKGHRIGGCHVSEKHANFILNEDDASAADIESMIEHVRAVVRERCDVELVAEVHIVGDPGSAA
ncbi:MAG: UDP-N-acetylmuramate dehydrogenase, partial [Gammaproteobacteria bacterium]|nr:UDP-N-acetylmuramate dehydrogenase [Gammaproteobacteria bacterium]